MKKITNNSRLGLIAMLLNAILLILIIVSVVKVSGYDTVNGKLQNVKPLYTQMGDSIKRVERAVHVCGKKITDRESVIAELNTQIDTLKAQSAGSAKAVQDSIKKVIEDKNNQLTNNRDEIKKDSTELVNIKDTLSLIQAQFAPIEKQYKENFDATVSPLKALNTLVLIVVFILIIKTVMMGMWMKRNMQNVCNVSPWMAKSYNKPLWGILGWFIPLYNLFKPCSFFSEMLSETNYILRDKSLVVDTKDGNHMETIGWWWGFHIFAKVLMPFIMGGAFICLNYWFLLLFPSVDVANMDLGFFGTGTFFGSTGLFWFMSHKAVITLFIIAWAVYAIFESYLIFSYNKLQKIMIDNENKLFSEEK